MKKEKKGKPPEQGGESPFQRFEEVAKKVVTAPKSTIEKSRQKTQT